MPAVHATCVARLSPSATRTSLRMNPRSLTYHLKPVPTTGLTAHDTFVPPSTAGTTSGTARLARGQAPLRRERAVGLADDFDPGTDVRVKPLVVEELIRDAAAERGRPEVMLAKPEYRERLSRHVDPLLMKDAALAGEREA